MAAVNYFGRRHSIMAARSWQSLGAVYSSMDNVPAAVNALLISLELFPDTTCLEYARTRLLLGGSYIERGMYSDAVNALRLARAGLEKHGDMESVALSEFKTAFAYQGLKRYDLSRPAFTALSDNPLLDPESRNRCRLQLAHIFNADSPNDGESARNALAYADAYIANCMTDSAKAVGYTEKGIAWYYLQENDSSFTWLQQSFRHTVEPATTSLNYYYMSAVAARLGLMRQALQYMRLYSQNEKKLNEMNSHDEITQMRLLHSEEMHAQETRAMVWRVVLISLLLLLLTGGILTIVTIQRDRRREAYYLQLHDEFILRQTREQKEQTGNSLQELCRHFRTGTAFGLIQDIQIRKRSLKAEERDVIVHDIYLYFADIIATLKADSKKINQQEICLMFCNALGLDQELIADILCTSRSTLRSIKSRLKSKISTETFSLFFGQ